MIFWTRVTYSGALINFTWASWESQSARRQKLASRRTRKEKKEKNHRGRNTQDPMEDVLVLNLPAEVATLVSNSGIDSKKVFLALARLEARQYRERGDLGNWYFGGAHIVFFL